MRPFARIAGFVLCALLGAHGTFAADITSEYAQGPGGFYRKDDRSGPYALGSDGTPMLLGLPMPFMRSGDPFFLPATTTAQQYQIAQPDKTRSYRGTNPCTVDVRVKTVASMAQTVTPTTGTRFLARTSETLGSTPSLTGSTRIVSIIALSDPGPNGCVFEIGYGNGG